MYSLNFFQYLQLRYANRGSRAPERLQENFRGCLIQKKVYDNKKYKDFLQQVSDTNKIVKWNYIIFMYTCTIYCYLSIAIEVKIATYTLSVLRR